MQKIFATQHGGSLDEDRHVGFLVATPGQVAARIISEPVATTAVASTLVSALGLDSGLVQAVQAEGTKPLPVSN